MGQFCLYSGISADLFKTCYRWLSNVNGGLSVATLGACGLFAAMCGSSPATAATMGTVCLPEMKKYGYKDTLSTGCLAAGGTLGILIPPSVAFILYGVATGNSIGALFASGLFPGILLTVLYMITAFIICKLDPGAGSKGESFTFLEKIKSLKGIWAMATLFIVVVGGILGGFFTANEGAAIGAVGGLAFMIARRKATLKNLIAAVYDAIKTSAMIFLIIIGAHVFGYFLTITKLPMAIGAFVAAMDVSPYVILILILLIFVVLGCFMDSLAMVMLLVPIFYPVILNLGMDPIWFGVLMVMVMEAGQITPPVGINVFVIAGVAKDVPLQTIFKGVAPFLAALLVATAIIVVFPQIAVWLPNTLYSFG
jgi:tripartite ATP-independent transporter DctM subunit